MIDKKDEFRALVARLHAHYDVPRNRLQPLYDAYTESWRTYHNFNHICHMAEGLSDLAEMNQANIDKWFEILFMIIYHDAWIKVRRDPGQSERYSAAWAVEDLLAASAPMRLIGMVQQGILATITHQLTDVDPAHHDSVSILLDLDLYGLGCSAESFQKDTEAIWGEYQPVYTRQEFDTGRSQWAANFLKRDRIYHTSQFEQFEAQARSNLERLAAS